MSLFESKPVRYPTLVQAAMCCSSQNYKELMEIVARGKMVNSNMTVKNNRLYYKAGKNRKAVTYEIDLNLPPEILAYQFETLIREVVHVVQQDAFMVGAEFSNTVSPHVYRKRLVDYYTLYCASVGMTSDQTSTSLDNICAAFDVGVITAHNIIMIDGVVHGVDNVYRDPNTGVLFAYGQPERMPLQPVHEDAHKQIVIKDTDKIDEIIAARANAVLHNINSTVIKTSGVTPYHSVVIPVTGR